MKLGLEHIGKKVTSVLTPLGGSYTVLAVDGNQCWLKAPDGYSFVSDCDNSWVLVEEPKLPSQIIEERLSGTLIQTSGGLNVMNSAHYANLRINEIIKILDEQWEKK